MTEFLRRGDSGMKSVKDMKPVQDGPPPGGFPSIRYGRRIPSTGPAGATIAAIVLGIMGYGTYKVIEGKRAEKRNEAALEEIRFSITPYLQAEQDRRYLRALEMELKMEYEVMKGVPGWKVGENVFQTRWAPYHMMPRQSVWMEADPASLLGGGKAWAEEAAKSLGLSATAAAAK